MLVCQSKVHPLLPMFFGKEGLFLFHHSFHPNYFKAVTHSLSMERLVGDVRKSLGHIHSSISLSRTNKTLCKTNVGCRKHGRTTTRRLREMRAMFRTKPRDGSNGLWRIGRRWCGLMKPKSTDLGQMGGSGCGKSQERT